VTDVETGCAFDSGSSEALSHSSRGSSVDSACCNRLCTNVSVVSELVERTSRRDAAGGGGGVFNDASSSLLSPVDHLSAAFDSDSEPSHAHAAHIEREYTSTSKSENRPFAKAISSPIHNGGWQMTTDS